MRKTLIKICFFLFLSNHLIAQQTAIESIFKNPPQSAKPWVFWYWLHGAVSKEGITADLEAMKEVGIGGAYLMPIKDTNSKIPFQPQVRQLTPEWWAMVKFALQEAKRLKIQIGVHVSDGFALAGGPWIKPEMSMQKLVWTKTFVANRSKEKILLPQPQANENYYKDIAVYAYPANYKNAIVKNKLKPVVTTSNGSDGNFLADENIKQTFRSDSNCWIQYSYTESVTVRQVKIRKQNNAYQSQRFIIQQSDDGIHFIAVDTLRPPRHGWQDWDEAYTHGIKNFTTKHIRFVWQKEGTEPGSEDLDAAKWKPVLRVQGIYVSDEPVVNNYEAKNGSVWRVAAATTNHEVSDADAVPLKEIINVTKYLQADGTLKWNAPKGTDWVIVRIGHTSTGAVNSTAGGGKGLECDKFSNEATTLQFNNWFGKFYSQTDPILAKEVIKVFHVDSWECGSQNWSKNFAAEYKKKRGYDLLPWLIVMTGTPVNDAATSEKILHDVRETIAELVNDKFYATLKKLSNAKGVKFSAESIAPTFVSDGLMHYKYADIPMGEFWLNSPTHDKPNDMLDAISGGHIYGKNIIAAEAFTTLRSDWGEHPGNLKTLGDRAFAAGINKLSLHVMMHNPWMDRKPGMTLDGIGLFYQRDQTWFKQSKSWIEYLTRCQALLQLGKPVVDVGVFIGEEIPRRSVLPDRLVSTLPGLFGKEKVEAEQKRLLNEGQPQRTIPEGVSHSANMADPENFIDALNGYQYDCFNPDVLMQMKVVKGKVVTPAGSSYSVLVIPGKHPMNSNAVMSDKVKSKLKALSEAGAKIIVDTKLYGLKSKKFIGAPYTENSLEKLGVKRDVVIANNTKSIAWSHRKICDADIYYVSFQEQPDSNATIQFNIKGKLLELYDIENGLMFPSPEKTEKNLPIYAVSGMQKGDAYFFVFKEPYRERNWMEANDGEWKGVKFKQSWNVVFDSSSIKKNVVFDSLVSWTELNLPFVKYYSGSAIYQNNFNVDLKSKFIDGYISFDSIYDNASIRINGKECGLMWRQPWGLAIPSEIIVPGENKIEIEVTNTWRNKLIYDELHPEERTTWFNSPYSLKNKPLLPAGIVGEVKIFIR